MTRIWNAIRARQFVAVAVVTVLTLAIIGGILVTSTSLGCGPAKALGLKTIGSGCGQQVASRTPGVPTPSPQATPSSTFAPSPSPSPSPTPAFSPSPLPSASILSTGPASGAYPPFYPGSTGSSGVTIPAFTLNCRLPVFVGPSGSGGFIVFPGNTFIADPNSAATLPSLPAGEPSPSTGSPYNQQQMSYDAPHGKWLAVSTTMVTPDGSRYAFTNANGIWVVDVATGDLSEIGKGQAWTIVGVEAAGVYATPSGQAGLWLVPFSGDARQITSGGFWQAVSANAGYGSPTSAVPQGVTNDIIRVNLSTGQVATWFRREGAQSQVYGVGPGDGAIVSVNYYGPAYANETWLVPSAGHGIPLAGNGSTYGGLSLSSQPVTDSNGIWFAANVSQPYGNGGQSGFALYIAGKGWYWMSSFSAQLAGGCVRP